MPRVIRKAKRRSAGYGEEHVRHLLHGVALCPGHAFRTVGHESDFAAMEVAWNILRDQLMPAWIAEHPGTRPYAWWKFDAPERRLRTDGVVHPFDDRLRKSHVEEVAKRFPSFRDEAYKLTYGRPNCLCVSDDFAAVYETEQQFLDRLDLLTASEKEGLGL